MTNIFRSAFIIGGIATLAAAGFVATDAAAQSNKMPLVQKGTAFQQSLSAGYTSFGNWEYQQADFSDAAYFNDRAAMSAAGQAVEPTVLANRSIATEHQGELSAARVRLTQALVNPAIMNQAAVPAGAAQVYFDCWAEQAEEGHQPEHIAYCKRGFETAMGQLSPAPMAKAPATKPAAAPARPYIVFFDWDKSNLSASTMPAVDEIASTLKKNANARIRIVGHADKSGTNTYNDKLSQRRAQSVMNVLGQKGVSLDRATLEFFGESRPLVDTADSVREPQNRRVEVTVQ